MNDREKLIAIMAQGCRKSTEENGVPCCGESFCKDNQKSCYGEVVDHLLANGVTVQRWIPVTERLPEKWQNVLTVRTDGGFRLDFIGSAGVWYEDVNFVRYPVTHWMPLPQPPKEVE